MKTLVTFSLILFTQLTFADTFFVEPVRGSSATESDKETVGELIRMGVAQGNKHTVAANKASATWTLAPVVMKLGDSYVLTLEKKDKSGQTVFAEKMKAKTMSDMDTVATRLTQAVLNGTKFADTADVTNITPEEETMNTRRYQATRQWMLGIGPGWSSNLRSSGGGFTFLIGYSWGLDPDFAVDLAMNLNNGPKNDDSSYSDFSIGSEYHFSRTKFSPMVGLRLGYASARINNDECTSILSSCTEDRASGWGTTLTAGYKLFRTSSVNMGILANYHYLFDKTSAGNPSLTAVQIVVYY